jgi:hypothetical protein
MSWGTNRRNMILFTFFSIVFLILGTIAFLFFYEAPNCFDNKQNGDEQGIDCGGSCTLLCKDTTIDLNVVWARQFQVGPGNYNAIAYVENQNIDAGIVNLPYEFRLLDDEDIALDQKRGFVTIRPKEIVPIIENNFNTGVRVAVRTDFRFLEEPVWEKQVMRQNNLIIKDERIDPNENFFTRITASVLNSTLSEIRNIRFVVLVYDENNNAIASSGTLIERLTGNETRDILFTWPTNFNNLISRFEIIPLYE